MYDRSGYSIELLREFFNGISLKKHGYENDTEKYSIALNVKNRYLCNVIVMTCGLNDYKFGNFEDSHCDAIVPRLLNEFKWRRSISFDEALNIITAQELLDSVKWLDEQCHFCFAVLQQYTIGTTRKRKVSSIIEDL